MATDGAHYARYHPYGDPAESERPSGRDQAPPDYPGHGASVLEMSVIATTEEEDGAREDVDVGVREGNGEGGRVARREKYIHCPVLPALAIFTTVHLACLRTPSHYCNLQAKNCVPQIGKFVFTQIIS